MPRHWISRTSEVICGRLDDELNDAGLMVEGVSAWNSSTDLIGVDFVAEPDAADLALAQAVVDAHDGTDYDTTVSLQADTNAAAIPGWSTWDEDSAEAWYVANISDPLVDGRNNLPNPLTLATTRLAILGILDILDAMATMLWAMARMVIALRNKTWPPLQER